ncbi:dehydrogenase [Streptomyces sp. MMG1533]|uniref:hypothetical protein n=1 Tax=Streptomyces sp. MMG1533 TaxID=1415546 RepID=UPI0006AEF375|nr:hypothetical protein [Streptomyces sp. MMG1533]KOU57225.1 dehydrogenase [Streptomyces sp. MMG1533]
MSTEAGPADPACPDCDGPLTSGGMLLARREEDSRRVCRVVLRCAGRHVWWRWSDRPEGALERCPYPQLF